MTYNAPDSEAIAQGFRLPKGTDLIRTGDDDVKHNAKTAAGLHVAQVNAYNQLKAAAVALPAGATPTVELSGAWPSRTITIGVPAGAPGMGYEAGQQLLTQNAATLAAAQQAAADAQTALQAQFLTQDEGVAALIETGAGPKTRAAILAATVPRDNAGSGPVHAHLRSLPDAGDGVTDSTSRITLESYQTAHFDGSSGDGSKAFGEVIRVDCMTGDAKGMIAWRLPANPRAPFDATTNPMKSVVWTGAHWNHYGDPNNIHGHWSLEVPDTNGDLQSRFGVEFVSDSTSPTATIGTDRPRIFFSGDIAFGLGDGSALMPQKKIRIGGTNSVEKIIEFGMSAAAYEDDARRRFALVVNATQENGNDLGTDMAIRSYDDYGAPHSTVPFFIRRSASRVGFGVTESGADTVAGAKVTIRWAGDTATPSGLHLQPAASPTAGGSAIHAILPAAGDRVLGSLTTTDANHRFRLRVDGTLSWGDGASSPATNLYRESSGDMRLDKGLRVDGNVRVNTVSVGGMSGGLALGNVTTPPSANPSAGGVIYVEAGSLKYRGSGGTVTTLGPA